VQLVTTDDPILHHVCRSDSTVSLDEIRQMFRLMREQNGLGLAAPQVGIDARLFVTDWGEIFVNPQIVQHHGTWCMDEGCLSLPGITRRKQRHLNITLADGRAYHGMQAVVIQHEINHLDGRLITDA